MEIANPTPQRGIHLSFGRASIKGNKRERTNLVADKNKCNVEFGEKDSMDGIGIGASCWLVAISSSQLNAPTSGTQILLFFFLIKLNLSHFFENYFSNTWQNRKKSLRKG